MHEKILVKGLRQLALVLIVLAAMVAPSFAVDYYLVAKEFTQTLPDPDGPGPLTAPAVTMWGFVEDPGGTCFNTADYGSRFACANALPDPTIPGPRLTAGFGTSGAPNALRIFLTNALTVPTSIVIPGQMMPDANSNDVPTWNDGTTGARAGSFTKRVRSFGREAQPKGGKRAYIWSEARNNPLKAGTFLYQSGTLPPRQVPMGLYGALTVDSGSGEAYPGVSYDSEVVLVYSEIDPAQHAAASGANKRFPRIGSANPRNYKPAYFLINGQPFDPFASPNPGPPIPAGNAGQNVLIRMLNAGLQSHMPMLYNGGYMRLVAEDGNPYPYPREQYSAHLPPGKTIDALWTPSSAATYPLFDRSHHLTSGGFGDSGMLAHLEVSPAVPAPETVTILRTRYFSGQVRVWADYTAAGPGATLTVTGNPGAVSYGPMDFFINPDFDYRLVVTAARPLTVTVDDGAGGSDTKSINPVFTASPIASPDAYNGSEGGTLVEPASGVLTNDSKGGYFGPNFGLKAVVGTLPTNGTLTLNPDGSFTYTHNGSEVLFDTFTYQAQAINAGTGTNVGLPSNETVVSLTITPVNDPPVAIDDAASTDNDTAVAIDVLANDTDAEGNALSVNSFTQGASGTVAPDGSGGLLYTPTGTGDYVDTFTYNATDGTDVSNFATVTVTVAAAANQPPVAVDDSGATTACDDVTVLCSSVAVTINVVANDTDPDGTVDPTTVSTATVSKNGGQLTNNGDGTVTYQPPPGFLGTDLFRYTVNDDNGAVSNQGTVRVNVVQ